MGIFEIGDKICSDIFIVNYHRHVFLSHNQVLFISEEKGKIYFFIFTILNLIYSES